MSSARTLFRVLVATFILTCAVAASAADPFTYTAPSRWRPERIPFPLRFAPELKYRGFEELRFGPGMFQPGAETYWTYGFFWWLEGKQRVDATTLKRDLEIYYKGLSRAVWGSRKPPLDLGKVTSEVTPSEVKQAGAKDEIHAVRFKIRLRTYDAFATGNLLDLRAEVSVHHFAALDRTWVWFSVAPKGADEKVWSTMRSMRDSFALRR